MRDLPALLLDSHLESTLDGFRKRVFQRWLKYLSYFLFDVHVLIKHRPQPRSHAAESAPCDLPFKGVSGPVSEVDAFALGNAVKRPVPD